MNEVAYSLRLKSDDELCTMHDRSILDVEWLKTMAGRMQKGSSAHNHYAHWRKKEEDFLDALEHEMSKRKLFSN